MAKKEQEQTSDMIPVVAETKDIKSLIYVVRGQQVTGMYRVSFSKLLNDVICS